MSDATPVLIRLCEKCGRDRVLEPAPAPAVDGADEATQSRSDQARCGCGLTPLNDADIEALSGRGP